MPHLKSWTRSFQRLVPDALDAGAPGEMGLRPFAPVYVLRRARYWDSHMVFNILAEQIARNATAWPSAAHVQLPEPFGALAAPRRPRRSRPIDEAHVVPLAASDGLLAQYKDAVAVGRPRDAQQVLTGLSVLSARRS